jgi:hypothetical protein
MSIPRMFLEAGIFFRWSKRKANSFDSVNPKLVWRLGAPMAGGKMGSGKDIGKKASLFYIYRCSL